MASRYAPGMTQPLVHPPKAQPGDRIAVVSPSFAAPGFAPAVHEQAMRRLAEVTGLVPVEYPTTRQLGASAEDRARDLNAAFADPQIRAVIATVGGEDQITVIGHLDADAVRADPKPFLGYSDNTNLHQWLWANGVASFYGGSTQVHLGPGPAVDEVHAASLRAALLTGGRLEITEPGESEDHGVDWLDPRALTEFGTREPVPGPHDDGARGVDLGGERVAGVVAGADEAEAACVRDGAREAPAGGLRHGSQDDRYAPHGGVGRGWGARTLCTGPRPGRARAPCVWKRTTQTIQGTWVGYL